MTEHGPRGHTGDAMSEGDGELRALLVRAGRRPGVPAEDLAALREAARGEWARLYPDSAHRSRRRAWLGLAAAAALLAALGLAWWARQPRAATGGPALAVVERVTGSATWRLDGDRPLALQGEGAAASFVAGVVVETGAQDTPAARVALRTSGGASLRLDAGSSLRLVAAGEVELLRGAVYVDSRAGVGGPRLTVRTASGVFEEMGTQFEVRLLPAAAGAGVRLRVREGSVALTRGAQRLVGAEGEELLLAGQELARRRLAPDDPAWRWVLDAAPPFAAPDPTVREVLDWVAREAGWRLELVDADVAAIAEATTVHGSIAHLRPTDALRPVLASAGLAHRIDDGRLIVTAPPVAR
jgi:hypothetical protein